MFTVHDLTKLEQIEEIMAVWRHAEIAQLDREVNLRALDAIDIVIKGGVLPNAPGLVSLAVMRAKDRLRLGES